MTTYNIDVRITGTISDAGIITPPPDPGPGPGPGPDPGPPQPGQPSISVGPTRAMTEPADALAYVAPGGTIIMDDGTYYKPFHTEVEGLTLKSLSGNPYKCFFDGGGGIGGGHRLAYGKGMVHCGASVNFIGVGFTNCGSPASGDNYSNEAGIWAGDTNGNTPVNITVSRCAFDNNANGCFTSPERNITFLVTECLYGYKAPNGKNASYGGGGTHPAHDNYLECGSIEVTQCMFWGCANGHNVKSRALKTNVHDNSCMTQDGGRVLDVPDGGECAFTNNTVYTRKDRASDPPQGCYGNSNMLSYCGESANNGTPGLNMSGNTLHISRVSSTIWANMGSKIASTGDTVKYYEDGSLVLTGNVTGLRGGSALPNAPPAPSLPQPPTWAKP